jgi:hypothetical protein
MLMTALGAVVVVTRVPNPEPIALFSDNSCPLPCWREIMPGKTSINEALRILRSDRTIDVADTYIAGSAFAEFTVRTSQGAVESRIFFKRGIVTHMYFYLWGTEADYQLASLIAWLGGPQHVTSMAQMSLYLSYDGLDIHGVITPPPRRMGTITCNRVRAPLYAIGLGSLQNLKEGSAWQGFDRRFNDFCRYRF